MKIHSILYVVLITFGLCLSACTSRAPVVLKRSNPKRREHHCIVACGEQCDRLKNFENCTDKIV